MIITLFQHFILQISIVGFSLVCLHDKNQENKSALRACAISLIPYIPLVALQLVTLHLSVELQMQ